MPKSKKKTKKKATKRKPRKTKAGKLDSRGWSEASKANLQSKGRPKKADNPKDKESMVVVSIPHVENLENNEYLRMAVAQTYITTPGLPIEELLNHPKYGKHLNLSTVYDWSRKDNWVEKRRAFMARLQDQIQRQILNEEVNIRTEQTRRFQFLYDKAMDKALEMAEEDILEVRSFEALLNALTRSYVALDDQRAKIMEQVIPEVPKAVENPLNDGSIHDSLKPQLSNDEARSVVMGLLESRRTKLRKDLKDAGVLKDEDIQKKRKKKPPKKVL